MGIYNTIYSLKNEQIRTIGKEILSSWIPGRDLILGNDAGTLPIDEVKNQIKIFISSHTKEYSKINGFQEEHNILELCKKRIGETIENLSSKNRIKPEYNNLKNQILNELNLLKIEQSDFDDKFEAICRQILLLIFKSFNQDENRKFMDGVKKDAENLKQKITEDILSSAKIESILLGSSGALTIVGPIVAGIILQRITQGFLAWIAVTIFGFMAVDVAILSVLAGPIGWGVAILATFGSGIYGVFKYKSKIEEINFIQTILSSYIYRYLNCLN